MTEEIHYVHENQLRLALDTPKKEILALIPAKPMTISTSELLSHFSFARPTLWKHLRDLLQKGLIRKFAQGKYRFYQRVEASE